MCLIGCGGLHAQNSKADGTHSRGFFFGIVPLSTYVMGYQSKAVAGFQLKKTQVYLGLATHLYSKYGFAQPHNEVNRNAGIVRSGNERIHINLGYERSIYSKRRWNLGIFSDVLAGKITLSAKEVDVYHPILESYERWDETPSKYLQLTIGASPTFLLSSKIKITARIGIGESLTRVPIMKDPSIKKWTIIMDHVLSSYSIGAFYRI